jgi:hypothetical protein
MNNQITQLLIIALAIVPFTNALVGVVKKSFPKMKSNFYPLIALISGILIGFVSAFLPNIQYTVIQMIMAGAIAGMASCGVYQIATVTTTSNDSTTNNPTV